MTCVLFTIALVVGAPAPKEAKPRPLLLLGEWVVSTLIECGENETDAVGDKLSFTADGKCVLQEGKEKPETMKFTVNAKREPAEIDITSPGDGKKDVVTRGIYKIDGDVLTICLSDQGDRPKDFASPAGSSINLVKLSRIKMDK